MAVKATILNNGPIRLEASDPSELAIFDPAGKMFGLAGRTVISLCRCGHSANKPFCDGAHNREGFQSVCEGRELPPPKPRA
ncbi:MAG: CDGSH iron-sulfur domain-containing protein [Bryobacteraceae bacterium]|jgi:CDGSH-type Zn-finger protein